MLSALESRAGALGEVINPPNTTPKIIMPSMINIVDSPTSCSFLAST